MDVWSSGLILLFGLFLTLAFQFTLRLLGSGGSQVIRELSALSELRRKALVPGSPGETISVSKQALVQAIDEATRRSSIMSWLQNFLWFSVGTGVSIFSNEIRQLIGLG